MTPQRPSRETLIVGGLAACASILAFLHYYHRGQVLLYGDAEAHIGIARRVFDSRTPGLLQLGTVWLPLPHLLMIPFVWLNWAWQTGIGGSVPSMGAYVFATVGVFRLVRNWVAQTQASSFVASFSAAFAALLFGANSNILYLQSTAMTEPLYLALFIWSVVYLSEFLKASDAQQARPSILRAGICLAAATLTRYDGWLLACVAGGMVLLSFVREKDPGSRKLLRGPVSRFLLLVAAGPVLWLVYNAVVYKNPLVFANGAYSAKSIERRIVQPPHPGTGQPFTAGLYFAHAVELNLAPTPAAAKLWLLLAGLGTLLSLRPGKRAWPLWLLWLPLPFYALSMAYGGVPIFVPDWWPFGQYNLRYGLQLLLAVAVFSWIAIAWLMKLRHGVVAATLCLSAVIFLGWCEVGLWRAPVSLVEAVRNMEARGLMEEALVRELTALPPGATILMSLRDNSGVPPRAGIALRQFIFEADQRSWVRPSDPEGLWVRALANPACCADYAVGFTGDAVAETAERYRLVVITSLQVHGQPEATIYRVH